MAIADIRKQRGVPAKRGMKVEVDGKPGVITRAKRGYLMVRFEGWNVSAPCHPRWRFTYIHADGRRESYGDDGKATS